MELTFDLLAMLENEINPTGMQFNLNENLGNFKGVQKGMINAFKEFGNNTGKAKLSGRMGQNSPFNTEEAKTTADAIRKFETAEVVGFVIQLKDGKQVLAVAKHKVGSDVNGAEVYYVMDGAWLKEKNPAAYEKADKLLFLPAKEGTAATRAQSTKFIKLHAAMTALIRAAKDNQMDPQIILISADTDRAAKKGERATAKQGRQPTAKELKYMSDKEKARFGNEFKMQLKMRLEKYKSSKADAVANPNDALKLILEKGFIDKIKVGGFVYNQTSDNIRFNALKGKDTGWSSESYVEYSVDTSDAAYEKARTDMWMKRKDMQAKMSAEEFEEAYDKLKEALPPTKIKIMLGLKGAAIAPTGEIKFSDY